MMKAYNELIKLLRLRLPVLFLTKQIKVVCSAVDQLQMTRSVSHSSNAVSFQKGIYRCVTPDSQLKGIPDSLEKCLLPLLGGFPALLLSY